MGILAHHFSTTGRNNKVNCAKNEAEQCSDERSAQLALLLDPAQKLQGGIELTYGALRSFIQFWSLFA